MSIISNSFRAKTRNFSATFPFRVHRVSPRLSANEAPHGCMCEYVKTCLRDAAKKQMAHDKKDESMFVAKLQSTPHFLTGLHVKHTWNLISVLNLYDMLRMRVNAKLLQHTIKTTLCHVE